MSLAMQARDDGISGLRRAHGLQRLVSHASIGVSPHDDPAGDGWAQLLATGAEVFVNFPGSVTHHDIVAACVRLRRAGFTPVPHVAARHLASFTQARDFLRRAAGEAAVTSVLLVAGDAVQPTGPFGDTLELLETGLLEDHGIGHVFFAGYPEGHPLIDRHSLDAALRAKLVLARRRGLGTALLTQFGFDAAPIAGWVAKLREEGILCPIRVGIAGPASIATLAKFAVRCGIGASLRALGRGQSAFARILTEAVPDPLIADLVDREMPEASIAGLHFFTFGGPRGTVAWLRGIAVRDRVRSPD